MFGLQMLVHAYFMYDCNLSITKEKEQVLEAFAFSIKLRAEIDLNTNLAKN